MASRPVAARGALLSLLGVALALAGCGGAEQSGSESPSAPATTTAAARMTVTAYFLRDGKVAPVHLRAPQSEAVARAALEAVLAGPPSGYESAIPAGTRLLGLTIDNGVATVDLSQDFRGVDAPAEAQLVYTLTRFGTVDGVSLQIEGSDEPLLGSEREVLDHPATRADYETETPAILIETPAPGDTVGAPLRIAGTSNVFEANMALQVFQNDTKLVDTFVTASSGSGDRGTFDAEVPLDVTGPVRIVMYAPSAENGQPQHQVEVPVTVAG